MKKVLLIGLCTLLSLVPGAGCKPNAQALMAAYRQAGIQAHAFYLKAAASCSLTEVEAVLRLAQQAAAEYPGGQAVATPMGQGATVSLALACPPDARMAQDAARRMRMVLGADADMAVCLTGRSGNDTLAALSGELLASLGDSALEGLMTQDLVSLTGENVQVALRKSGDVAMVFLAMPHIPMDY